jgi:putative FmdB family regulatory protein
MPVYVFECPKCGFKTDFLESCKDSNDKIHPCEKCTGNMVKIPGTFKFDMLKFSRFYRT